MLPLRWSRRYVPLEMLVAVSGGAGFQPNRSGRFAFNTTQHQSPRHPARFAASHRPGEHHLNFHARLSNGHTVEMSYLLYLPVDYGKNHGKKPLLLFLHGAGSVVPNLAGIYIHGPMKLLAEDGGNARFRATCPFVFLARSARRADNAGISRTSSRRSWRCWNGLKRN